MDASDDIASDGNHTAGQKIEEHDGAEFSLQLAHTIASTPRQTDTSACAVDEYEIARWHVLKPWQDAVRSCVIRSTCVTRSVSHQCDHGAALREIQPEISPGRHTCKGIERKRLPACWNATFVYGKLL